MNALEQWWHSLLPQLPDIALGFVLMALIILSAGPLARLLMRPLTNISKSQLIRTVTLQTIKWLIILFGVYLFLIFAGLTSFAVAILSGTGVAGLIIGFAFKDIAENFISSLLLSIQRPFRIGDVIEVEGNLGVIKQVTSRATTLVDFDGNHIQIPNATIYKNVIKNFSANPNMRGHFIIGVGYTSDVSQAQKLAMDVMRQEPAVLDSPEPQVLVDNLGASTYNLKVYFWIDATQISVLKMSSKLMRVITSTFEAHDIAMPDDAREVVFPQGLKIFTADSAQLPSDDVSVERQTSIDKKEVHSTPKPVPSDDEDVSSEIDEIRKQASSARDPESGSNIL